MRGLVFLCAVLAFGAAAHAEPKQLKGDEIRQLLAGHTLFSTVADDPTVQKFAADGTAVSVSTPQELQALIKSELARWAQVVKASGIKSE